MLRGKIWSIQLAFLPFLLTIQVSAESAKAYLVAQTQTVDEPLCYFQTADGRRFNLNNLCQSGGGSRANPQTPQPTAITFNLPPGHSLAKAAAALNPNDGKAVAEFERRLYGD